MYSMDDDSTFFIKEDDATRLKRITSFESNVVGTYIKDMDNDGLTIRKSNNRSRYMDNPIAVSAVWEDQDNIYQLNKSIEYNGNFGPGDCGSLLYLDESKFQSRILVGLHIAGDGKTGFSTSITQEFLHEALDLLYGQLDTIEEEEIPEYVQEKYEIKAHSSLSPVAELSKEYVPGDIIKNSQVVMSLITS